ncbi:MAG: gamma-glutamylcyclotransferase family protein [Pseudomonadota bacterium]
MKHLVFVYGTLKENFPNFGRNKGLRLPGIFTTVERYPLYLVGERFSPWLVNTPGKGERVSGQVFAVDQTALATMDTLERITEADGYRRVTLALESTEARDTQPIHTLAYLKQATHCTPAMVREGPLSEYTLEHAALYLPRD